MLGPHNLLGVLSSLQVGGLPVRAGFQGSTGVFQILGHIQEQEFMIVP